MRMIHGVPFAGVVRFGCSGGMLFYPLIVWIVHLHLHFLLGLSQWSAR